MTLKIFRRGSARCIGLLSAFATILLCLYYISIGQSSPPTAVRPGETAGHIRSRQNAHNADNKVHHSYKVGGGGGGGDDAPGICQLLEIADTDITTMAEYSKFEFQVRIKLKQSSRIVIFKNKRRKLFTFPLLYFVNFKYNNIKPLCNAKNITVPVPYNDRP